jgi:hypothetical protein
MPALAPARALVVIAREAAGDTVIVAVACRLGLAALVAVIVTEVLLVIFFGVKTPLLEILPALADQVTAVFAVPLTLAVKSCCPFAGMVVLLGESKMVMLGLEELGGVLGWLLETMISKELEPDCVELNLSTLCSGTGRGLSETKSTDL